MKNTKQSSYITRESVLKELSDEEVARVSMAETAIHLNDGDEYVDMEKLVDGVKVARGLEATASMGRLLPRKAVHTKTWDKIVSLLG